jgi:hypothetical protein
MFYKPFGATYVGQSNVLQNTFQNAFLLLQNKKTDPNVPNGVAKHFCKTLFLLLKLAKPVPNHVSKHFCKKECFETCKTL